MFSGDEDGKKKKKKKKKKLMRILKTVAIGAAVGTAAYFAAPAVMGLLKGGVPKGTVEGAGKMIAKGGKAALPMAKQLLMKGGASAEDADAAANAMLQSQPAGMFDGLPSWALPAGLGLIALVILKK